MKGKSWEIFGPHKIPNNKVGCKKVSFSLLEIVSPCIPQNPQYKKASENAYVLLSENWFHKEKSFDKDSSCEPKSFCTNQCSLDKNSNVFEHFLNFNEGDKTFDEKITQFRDPFIYKKTK